LAGKFEILSISLTALLSPIWYFLAIRLTNGRVWVLGYFILLVLWIAQFSIHTYKKNWTRKQYFVQVSVGLLCFLPFTITAFTFLAWTVSGFAP